MWILFFIPGPSSEEVNTAKQENYTTYYHVRTEENLNTLFITNNSFVILKNVIKSVFSKSPTISEKAFQPFFFQIFIGVGEGGTLIINFLWPCNKTSFWCIYMTVVTTKGFTFNHTSSINHDRTLQIFFF